MGRVRLGDSESFAALYGRHATRALRVASATCHDRLHAQDAVQEAFATIWRNCGDYRPERGKFQAWAMQIVRYRALDLVRKAPGNREIAFEAAHEPSTPNSVEAEAIARSEARTLIEALRKLPKAQAEVITLAFYGELTHTEIASELRLPPGTVKGRMRLGMEKLNTSLRPPPASAAPRTMEGGLPDAC